MIRTVTRSFATFTIVLVALLALATSAQRAAAKPVTASFTLPNVDWTSAGVGGVGGGNGIGGTGTIHLTGVTGPVTHAFLYWHGIDNFAPRTSQPFTRDGSPGGSTRGAITRPTHATACDGVYNVPVITFNGTPVHGVALGDATTNCWGDGSSRAFRADVTNLVTGNGDFTISNVTTDECDDMNGASLIVLYDDGNPNNNRDLVFFEGNDSNLANGFPGEDDGWHATLPGISFTTGTASVQLHVADGQNFTGDGLDDNTLTFSAGGPAVTIPDALNRYDGSSVTDAGFSRSQVPGTLWDIHTFDITPIFTTAGGYTLQMDGQDPFYDCTGLVLLIVNLEAGAAPVAAKPTSWGHLKAAYR